jgi:nucleotide-binding universal stress UspA family protein
MYERILVAIDGSEPSRLGLDEAVRLARTLGSSLLLVHAVNKTPWAAPTSDPVVLQRLVDDLRCRGESVLEEAMTVARTAGVEADFRLIEAIGKEAGECVIQEAASWKADLIVSGTHGRRGLRRLLLGSDAEYIVRHSSVPVLLVRATSSRSSDHSTSGADP